MLTQFSSVDGEVLFQDDPLLDLLGVRRGSGVDTLEAFLNGFVERRLLTGNNL